MASSLLRERVPGRHAPVTSVELFFDLVFAFAMTQVSHGLLEHLSWTGALQSALLLLVIWCAWVYTAWNTNWLDPERPLVRILLFVLMGVGLIMSGALPEAFGERGLIFAGAYITFQIGRTIFIRWAVRGIPVLSSNFTRVLIWMSAAAVLWIAGGLVEGPTRLVLWTIAVGLEYAGPALAFMVPWLGSSDTHDWNIEGSHIAERCSLFVMLCLGESILVTGAGFAALPWTTEVVAGLAVALSGSISMWWIYFSKHAELASEIIAASDDPGRMARMAYTYVPIPIVAGIILSAVGDELVLAHPGGHIEPATALVLTGGPALFLVGLVLFKFSVFGTWSMARIAGLGLLVALYAVSGVLSPLLLAAAAASVLVFVAAWETVLFLRQPNLGTSSSAVDFH